MSTAHSSSLLSAKLAGVRGKQRILHLGTGFSWISLALVALLGVGMFIDWRLNLDEGIRAMMLVGYVAVLIIIFRRHIFIPLANQPDNEEVALQVENSGQFPDYRSRLIASTQFGEQPLPSGFAGEMVSATIQQTEEISRSRDFNSIVATGGFTRAFLGALVIVGLGALVFSRNAEDALALLKRAFLVPGIEVPRDTHMGPIQTFAIDGKNPGPRQVFTRGDRVQIRVSVDLNSRKLDPDTAEIAIKFESSDEAVVHSVTNSAVTNIVRGLGGARFPTLYKRESGVTRMFELGVMGEKYLAITAPVQNGKPAGKPTIKETKAADEDEAYRKALALYAKQRRDGYAVRGIYEYILPNARENFTVTASAGDAFEVTKEVKVESRPAVREIEFTQEFPSYTGIPKSPRRRGDLAILQGSKLDVTILPSKPVSKAVAFVFTEQGGSQTNRTVAAQVRGPDSFKGELKKLETALKLLKAKQGADDSKVKQLSAQIEQVKERVRLGEVTVSLPMRDLDITGFSIKLFDKNGFDSRNEAFYRVAMLPDKPPVIRVLEPIRREEKLTTRARLPLMVQVRDDYGVDQIYLMIAFGNAPPRPPIALKPVPIPDPQNPGQTITPEFSRLARIPHDLLMATINNGKAPDVGHEIEYWFEATDRCAPQQGRGTSRKLLALVVSDEEKRRDLQNRASDSITGVNETASDQQQLNERLGEIIRVQAIPAPPKNE